MRRPEGLAVALVEHAKGGRKMLKGGKGQQGRCGLQSAGWFPSKKGGAFRNGFRPTTI